MQYNGKELIEMTPDKWDGKSRRMLAWNDDDKTWSALICGYNPLSKSWICADSSICFSHCAEMEIPEEESDAQKKEIVTEYSLNDCINALKYHFKSKNEDSPDDEIVFPSLKESYKSIIKYLDELKSVKEENTDLKSRIKALCVERGKMANAVSGAVWKELMDMVEDIAGPDRIGLNEISDIVLNKILQYKQEKKFRKMTYKELDEWLEQGKGVIRIAKRVSNTISYDCEDRNHEVSEYYKICGYDEDTWHEPMIED